MLDETGMMLRPLVRRTWAPVGQRPVLYCWDRRERLSVIAGLSVSARSRRLGLYFAIHEQNIRAEQVESFVRRVQGQLGRGLVVVMDRLSAHKAAAKRLAGDKRFKVEWLPPYAPDLNPAEAVWSHTKHSDLANYAADDLLELEIEAELSLEDTRGDQKLLRSFFDAARLKL